MTDSTIARDAAMARFGFAEHGLLLATSGLSRRGVFRPISGLQTTCRAAGARVVARRQFRATQRARAARPWCPTCPGSTFLVRARTCRSGADMEEVGAASAGETMDRREEEGDRPAIDTIQLRRPPERGGAGFSASEWPGCGSVSVAGRRAEARRDPGRSAFPETRAGSRAGPFRSIPLWPSAGAVKRECAGPHRIAIVRRSALRCDG
jgi:hypothetical protein